MNGYTLSQHIQGLPTNQSAKYTGYQLCQMAFKGELDEKTIRDIEQQQLQIRLSVGEDELNWLLSESYAESRGSYRVIQVVIEMFNKEQLMVQQLLSQDGANGQQRVNFIADELDQIAQILNEYQTVVA